MDAIVILDFGSQTSQLIARRVREAHVYCELFPHDASPEQILALQPKGFILSGGPASVYETGAPQIPDYVIESKLPILGICYGMQALTHSLGGRVAAAKQREYGMVEVESFVDFYAGRHRELPISQTELARMRRYGYTNYAWATDNWSLGSYEAVEADSLSELVTESIHGLRDSLGMPPA